MERLTTTPFGARPANCGQISLAKRLDEATGGAAEDKWALLREIGTARAAFGLKDRDLAVLHALLSFHPTRALDPADPLIVFPSNATLILRANGMAESTLRRHLATLCAAGLICRHDSPNGKRYARRDETGALARAFGFDLGPLVLRAGEIRAAAAETRAAAERLIRLREAVSLRLRDLFKLGDLLAEAGRLTESATLRMAEMRRAWRRRLSFVEVEALERAAGALFTEIEGLASAGMSPETLEMDGSDADFGRHIQNSKPDLNDLEPRSEKRGVAGDGAEAGDDGATRGERAGEGQAPPVPLKLVLRACPDIGLYAAVPPRGWRDLADLACFVRPMLGISPSAWEEAQMAMGRHVAAITLACILQRAPSITSPGGYLRALTAKAEEGRFSPAPMVMALLNASEKQAA